MSSDAHPVYRLMSRFKDANQSLKIYGSHDWRLTNCMFTEQMAFTELTWHKRQVHNKDVFLVRIRRKDTTEEDTPLNDDLPDFLKKQPDNYAELIAKAADKQAQNGVK